MLQNGRKNDRITKTAAATLLLRQFFIGNTKKFLCFLTKKYFTHLKFMCFILYYSR